MARGTIGRERMVSNVIGAHQEDLNNELLAVSFCKMAMCYILLRTEISPFSEYPKTQEYRFHLLKNDHIVTTLTQMYLISQINFFCRIFDTNLLVLVLAHDPREELSLVPKAVVTDRR